MQELEIPQWNSDRKSYAVDFCTRFLGAPASRRFIFGGNVYTGSVIENLDIAGVIDDFSSAADFRGVPVVRSGDVPEGALVVAASGGKPLTVASLLDSRGLEHLDYFAFLKFSGLPLRDVVFNEGFASALETDNSKAAWVRSLLADDASRQTIDKLFAFRSTLDVSHLAGFTDRQDAQYFEPFLPLPSRCVFWDIGGFDGFTTLEFARRFPDYGSILIFEPDPTNQVVCRNATKNLANVRVIPLGTGAENATLRFSSDGSASTVDSAGDLSIEVCCLDGLDEPPPTFIKMDIEGAEIDTLRGAGDVISKHHPALALSVYHRPTDFWRIPDIVMGYRSDYRVYVRHFTESIYETIMYFVPDAG